LSARGRSGATRAQGLDRRTRNLPCRNDPDRALRQLGGVRSEPAVCSPSPCVTCSSNQTVAASGELLARTGKPRASEQSGASTADCAFEQAARLAAGRRDPGSQALSSSGRMYQGHSIGAAPRCGSARNGRLAAGGRADRRAAVRGAAAGALAGRCGRAPARPRCQTAAHGCGCGSSATASRFMRRAVRFSALDAKPPAQPPRTANGLFPLCRAFGSSVG
jgi:hypothetical protein